ncbi:MAG TPA: DUF1844 domain-containing protein [Thermoanaerobaculia bacterium]
MSEIKVSDRRMFTPDGKLREEFEREFAEAAARPEPAPENEPEPVREPEPAAPERPAPAPPAAELSAPEGGELAAIALPTEPPPGLLEHVEFLASFALVAMGEMPLPDGRLVRDLDAARFYIDLLAAFHAKWSVALGPQEARFVESYLDQLRLRYVSHRG